MTVKISIDILKGCAEIIEHSFVVREFSGTKITSYEKALYNELLKVINKRKKK